MPPVSKPQFERWQQEASGKKRAEVPSSSIKKLKKKRLSLGKK